MENFSAAINGDTPVLVDFYAEWCTPCKTMSRILDELKTRAGGQVRILKVNIEKNPHVALLYRIKSVPTLLLFRKGRILWRWSGIVLPDELLRVLHSSGEPHQTVHYESHHH